MVFRHTVFKYGEVNGVKIYSAEQMKKTDSAAINEYGIDGIMLMENAANAVTEEIVSGDLYGRGNVLALCGHGNNGGDGFAVARRLTSYFECVKTAFFDEHSRFTDNCKKNFEIASKLGIENIDNISDMERYAQKCDVVVDALYGFGFRGALNERDREIVRILNNSGAYIVAVDIPSGVSADSGECEFALKADKTVTFTGYKPAQLMFPSANFCGTVCVRDIGIPPVAAGEYLGETICKSKVASLLPKRERNFHKGSCGRVFIIGGSRGMSGAVCMSALAAMKSGAGLVTAAVPKGINAVFEQKVTEAMSIAFDEAEDGTFDEKCVCDVVRAASKADTVIIGPGMGRSESCFSMLNECLRRCENKVVIDADALFALAADKSILNGTKAQVIITPHHAEMGRLIGKDAAWVERNAIFCAAEFSKEYNVTVVLKGAYTVVADGGYVYVNNNAGNAGMATGGSGDVLSGVTGALSCLMRTADAAVCAVYLHALAGDEAKKHFGMTAMTAQDIINSLHSAFLEFLP